MPAWLYYLMGSQDFHSTYKILFVVHLKHFGICHSVNVKPMWNNLLHAHPDSACWLSLSVCVWVCVCVWILQSLRNNFIRMANNNKTLQWRELWKNERVLFSKQLKYDLRKIIVFPFQPHFDQCGEGLSLLQ